MTVSAHNHTSPSSRKPTGSHHATRSVPPVTAPLKAPQTLRDDQRVVEVEPVSSSGVGVLDKATLILDCLEAGPVTLGQLVNATGLARPTAHRLAVALTHHRLVARDVQGRFMLGPRLSELASATAEDQLLAAAAPVLDKLRHATNESAQIYRRQGDWRVCVASAERPVGMRETIPVGTQLSMKASVRRIGWAQSVGERERGTASVSAPVYSPTGKVIAAVSIAGSIDRMSRQPGRMYAEAVLEAAAALTAALRAS